MVKKTIKKKPASKEKIFLKRKSFLSKKKKKVMKSKSKTKTIKTAKKKSQNQYQKQRKSYPLQKICITKAVK